jgi:hypothetical protein
MDRSLWVSVPDAVRATGITRRILPSYGRNSSSYANFQSVIDRILNGTIRITFCSDGHLGYLVYEV